MPEQTRSIPAPGGVYPLGKHQVARIGYGAMQLRHFADPVQAVDLLEHAIALGVDHIDTAQFYGDGFVNKAIAKVLRPGNNPGVNVVVASKVGADSNPNAPVPVKLAQRPEQLRASVEANLASLGLEHIPLVYLRRADVGPGLRAEGDQVVAIEDQMEVMIALRNEGKIGAIGLSAVTLEGVTRVLSAGIAAVQNAYSLVNRQFEDELQLCMANNIAWVPFFPLGGVMPGSAKVTTHSKVQAIAARLAAMPQQVGLAWLLRHSANTLLIPGTASLDHLKENIAAGSLFLDEDAMAELDSLETVGM